MFFGLKKLSTRILGALWAPVIATLWAVLVSTLVFAGPATQPSTQPAAFDLGVCLDGDGEAESAAPWLDLRHQFNRWQTANGDAKVDANGYALEEADSVCGFVGYPAGTYHV